MSASIQAASAATYYLQPDQTLYYLTGELGFGVWHGDGGGALGFRGEVTSEALMAAFAGFSPVGMKELVQHKFGINRQPAWDMTYSAPKCLSVLWSVVGKETRQRIESVVMEAAKRAVDYLDANALFTRRGKYGSIVEHAQGTYALCPHGTSRTQDPQLHIHALCLNLCLRADGTSGTIRSRDLYLHKMAAGAVFHLELAYLLLKVFGLKTRQDKTNPWTFVVDGIPEALCKEFSKRRAEIEQLAAAEGWGGPRVMAKLALETRKAKGHINLASCFKEWQAIGSKHGFTREVAEGLLRDGAEQSRHLLTQSQCAGDSRVEDLQQAIDQAIRRVATYDAYFSERKILQEANTLLQGKGFAAGEVIAAVIERLRERHQEIAIPTEAEYRFYSTKENIAAESALIDSVTKGRNVQTHIASEAAVARAIKSAEQRLSKALGIQAEFTADQRKSVRHITLTPGNVALVQGGAGTGKTDSLWAAHVAWKSSGFNVVGCSITGRAAQGLQKATGIPSYTIASLLRTLRPELRPHEVSRSFGEELKSAVHAEISEARRAGAWMTNPSAQVFKELSQAVKAASRQRIRHPAPTLSRNTILVVDEVAMLPTKAFLALKEECDKVGAKLVGVGDRMQLPPIEAGGPFWSLAKIIGYESLTTNVRQREQWMKEAVEYIIADRPLQALEMYAKHSSLVLAKHKNAAIEKLVCEYRKIPSQDLHTVAALASTNEEVRCINFAVQQRRKAFKEISLASIRLPSGERAHVGDIVALRKNDYEIDVRNGIRGTLIGIEHPSGMLRSGVLQIMLHGETVGPSPFKSPKVVTVDLNKYRDVQLGYAITTHMAQGVTLRESFVLLGDSMLSKNMAYTQLSRHTHRCTLFAIEAEYGDSLAQIAKGMARSVEKDFASDYRLKLQETQLHHREEQQLMHERALDL